MSKEKLLSPKEILLYSPGSAISSRSVLLEVERLKHSSFFFGLNTPRLLSVGFEYAKKRKECYSRTLDKKISDQKPVIYEN